jgi:hypothetical protein
VRSNVVGIGLAIAVATLVSTPVLGQVTPVGAESADEGSEIQVGELALADIRLGPFYLQPRLGIRELGWNSNVLGRPDASEQVSDMRVTPLAGLRFFLPLRRRHVISGDAAGWYDWYAEQDSFRAFSGAVEGRYGFDSERLDVDISHRYSNAQTNSLQRVELDSGGNDLTDEVVTLIRREVNTTLGEATLFISRRTFIGARGTQLVIRYDDRTSDGDAVARQLDRTEREAGGFVGMQMRPGLRVRLFYDFRRFEYVDPVSLRDADTYRTGLELNFDRGNRLEGLVRVGYRRLTPVVEGLVGFDGIVGDLNLTTVVSGRTEMTLRGDRDALPSLWGRNVFFVREGGGAELVFQFSRRIGIGGSIDYHRHAYEIETSFPQRDGSQLTAKRRDEIYQYEGILRIGLGGDEIRFRLGAYERQSNFDALNTSGLILSTGYVARF